ncbi:MAG: nuclear transport factor 2 family protein [Actinobacteria bacterium]|nr:nuclear transport factor 2 family protein [Actinomycetota bacterium]
MPSYPRDEMEEMVERWLAANRSAEEERDWRPLADLYTEDATYGWNLGPKEEFMVVGRDQIREIALGLEMVGLEHWTYPYETLLIDERKAQVIGLWRQVADATRADGSPYEVVGIGGSWFRYAGNFQWSWQRDFFDFGNVVALFVEMIQDGTLSEGMTRRMEGMAGGMPPGHFRLGEAPVGLWGVP